MDFKTSARTDAQARYGLSSAVLAAGFLLTGAGTVMLGILLPVFSARWSLGDGHAGLLLFLEFFGSTLGAVVTGRNRVRALGSGYALLVLCGFLLAQAGPLTAYLAFFLWGLGLGSAMTATSLIISDRSGAGRAVHLERLNLVWSLGAAAAPFLFVPFLRGARFQLLVRVFQALFLLAFLWAVFGERRQRRPVFETLTVTPAPDGAPKRAFLPLLALTTCAVGIETALDGWLTTYSHRAEPHGVRAEVLAAGFFLVAMVAGRLVFSTRLLNVLGRRRLLRLALWGAVAGTTLLAVSRGGAALDFAAALSGFSIGPLYPLALSYLLELSPRGWILGCGGVGAALFPWLTGALSSTFGGLRYGLFALAAAALLMVALASALPGERPGRGRFGWGKRRGVS